MATSQFLNAPIIVLKEGTDVSQGLGQITSNINACQSIVDIVKTTLGPRGMDKLIQNENSVTITNDGATVLDLLTIVHPAARTLVDIAKSQDCEIGDGTTSVVVLAGELLNEAKTLLQENVSPQIIISGYLKACRYAMEKIKTMEHCIKNKTPEEKQYLLQKCAETSLNSKLIAVYQTKLAKMIVDAVMLLDENLDKTLIGVKKVMGGSVEDSLLIDGVAFKKTFSYAGFEQQPKMFIKPKVLLLNIELELKAEKENAEVRIENPSDYQSIVDAEWTIIYDKLNTIVQSGAQIVFSRLPIGDLATQYFADRGIFCAGRVDEIDMKRCARATGGQVLSTVTSISPEYLGVCGKFEEIQIGAERYNILSDCSHTKTATIILRGGGAHFLDEAERSMNDAIMIVLRAIETHSVVGGAGSIEMRLSKELYLYSKTIKGKHQVIVELFSKALECIPKVLAQNSGFDVVDVLNKLRKEHYNTDKPCWLGVNCNTGDVIDAMESFIWEPASVKIHAIQSATEAACSILSIDETIRNPKSNPDPISQTPAPVPRQGMRRNF